MLRYIRVSQQHLRGTILQRPAEYVEELPWLQKGGRAEVDQPDVEVCVDDDVLVFDVSVQDAPIPEVTHCGHQLQQGERDS